MAARLTINDECYLLALQENGVWVDIARLDGAARSLIPANAVLNDAALERAIDRAEEWLMPYAKALQGKVLFIHDITGNFQAGLRNVLFVHASQFSVTDIEDGFLQVVALAARHSSFSVLLQQHSFVATLVLVRELAHHGALSRLMLLQS